MKIKKSQLEEMVRKHALEMLLKEKMRNNEYVVFGQDVGEEPWEVARFNTREEAENLASEQNLEAELTDSTTSYFVDERESLNEISPESMHPRREEEEEAWGSLADIKKRQLEESIIVYEAKALLSKLMDLGDFEHYEQLKKVVDSMRKSYELE